MTGRPGPQVAEHIIDSPRKPHLECRCLDLPARQVDVAVASLYVRALRRPVVADDIDIQPANRGIDIFRHGAEFVTPRRKYAAGATHAADFREESVVIEPVERLADRRQIDNPIGEARCFGAGDVVVNAWIPKRGFDLRAAGVGRDDGIEMPREFYRGLSAAGRAVPGELTPLGESPQPVEQCRRISRPVPRIARRLRGEVVPEATGDGSARGSGAAVGIAARGLRFVVDRKRRTELRHQ